MVDNTQVNLKEKSNDFGVIIAEIVGFEEDAVVGEPVKKLEVFDGNVFEFGDWLRAADNASSCELIFKSQIVGSFV